MQVPLQISFHDVDHSDAVEERIREKVAKLEQHCDTITSCRVVVERPHKNHRKGQLYNVRFDVTLPGYEIVVKGDKGDHAHEDVYVAIRDAFEATLRQVQDYVRRHKGL
ncbi:MAG: ribosome-associated translation inhibitor RaiA [Rhodospirillales bacterium]|nr:ribosome-associated translation inhibitor RaiA [Rhodospirillales bacterium]MCW8861238.1 ribosome-associated translation inhibitor RaiA [Rhodospirillales bacterium]MCW8953051.1 ribosome-associated translation inhibitor RaiA [Rhodospirillales bacterium]MCW8969658.1 ribosome-associated translation inhibitor RaiA [Rhodospirillales bacterium]MCW9001514.1 ribosome-associated translation inhibitor RaiA [Rhodospirillales bacterium]